MLASFYFGEIMLTWDEPSSNRSIAAKANKVMITDPVVRNGMLVPFDSHKIVKTMKSIYESFLAGCTLEPIYTAVECAYAWLLNWTIQYVQHSKPISQSNKMRKALRFERPRHFFSAQKLNMRNAP